MWDSRPVEVVLQLPEPLAEDLEELQRNDPALLDRIVRYGLTRRALFREMCREATPSLGAPGGRAGG